jgi:hypothetical protein
MDGKPFSVVSQVVGPERPQVLERAIVCRASKRDMPNQPGAEDLDADPLLHRVTIVFIGRATAPSSSRRSRSGASPA